MDVVARYSNDMIPVELAIREVNLALERGDYLEINILIPYTADKQSRHERPGSRIQSSDRSDA